MIKKAKNWILNRFMPAWAKDTIWQELQEARDKIKKKDIEILKLRAYIDGMEFTIRKQKQIVINTQREDKE